MSSVYRPIIGIPTDPVTCNVFLYQSHQYIQRFSLPSAFPKKSSYQTSIPSNMSHTPTATTSTSNYQSIFDNAIQAYKKKTKKDLRSHPLLDKLQDCDSPDAVLKVLYEQIPGFDQSRDTDNNLTKWLNPTVNVLCTFSGVVGGGIGLASPKKLRVKVVPDLTFDLHTGIPASCSDIHWNQRPSLSGFCFPFNLYYRAYRDAEHS